MMPHPDLSSSDLKDLSLDDLENIVSEANGLIQKKRELRLKEGFAQVQKIAKDLGVSVVDLISIGDKRTPHEKERRKPADKYRNPANPSEAWSGRGKTPRWLSELVTAGSKLEDFEVK